MQYFITNLYLLIYAAYMKVKAALNPPREHENLEMHANGSLVSLKWIFLWKRSVMSTVTVIVYPVRLEREPVSCYEIRLFSSLASRIISMNQLK